MKKKRIPRPIIPDMMAYIKQGELPATTAETAVRRFRVANHGAMDSLIKGKGTRQDTVALGHMLITSKALAVHDIGWNWIKEIQQAEDALKAIQTRGGRYILRATEITSLNHAIEVHDEQLRNCTVKELEDAINAAKNAIRHNHEVKELA